MRLTKRTTLLYSGGQVGSGAFYAFNNFVLPQLLRAVGAPDLLIGLLSSTRSIEGTVIQPTVGAISDGLRTRLGRRRPFIAVAVPLSAIFFLVASGQRDVLGLAIAIILFSIFFNIAYDPYVALIADIAEPAERALLSGVSNGIQLVAQVAFLFAVARASAGGIPAWTYAATAALLVGGFALTAFGVREPISVVDERGPRLGLRGYVGALIRRAMAMRFLACIFAFNVGFAAVLPYLTLFIVDDIHQSEETALALAAGTLLVTALSAIAFGKLAERIPSKSILLAGWALLAVAAVGGTVIQDLPQTIVVVVIAGIGNGAATAVAWPLLTTLIPPEEAGVFAGLKAAAESVSIPLSVTIAAQLFLPRFGYRGIFALLAIFIVIALGMLISLVQVPRLERVQALPTR